jgi:peptide/nickel transport system substrate-binding protein
MSPAALDELGDDFGQEPVCVGPFEFVERGNERIVLERAENYHDADQVKLDRVVYQTINDGNIRTANLRSGDVHMAERINTTDVEQIESDPGLTMYDAVSLGYWGIFVNIGNTDGIDEPPGEPDHPLVDPRVREAFELSLDHEALVKVAMDGEAQVGLRAKNKAAHPAQPNPHRGYSYVGQEILYKV